jgi:hypothetical protein
MKQTWCIKPEQVKRKSEKMCELLWQFRCKTYMSVWTNSAALDVRTNQLSSFLDGAIDLSDGSSNVGMP